MTATQERVIFARARDRDYTAEEYNQLWDELQAAKDRNDEPEVDRLTRLLPMVPYIVRAFKRVYGKEAVLEVGFDLTQANLEYGEGWLDEES
jgi:hypothetical protein